ncbi:hypothetical protein GCM10022223_40500 [Kineosporia mesophila]|uniref:Uncharacterized protein n=1 Tax=Kineosporia mesophila TaxID=566012 RepID=A0ABP6ZV14_9ACTN|nr:hypothetical protein [Kineosporia mesophila]MCD5348668.1 hypothetical protein [Kineosporia mesophila]
MSSRLTDLADLLTDLAGYLTADGTFWLGVVPACALPVFAACAFGIGRLRRALAADRIRAAIRPYRLADLDPGAALAGEVISERHVRRGRRGYAVVVLDLLAWVAALSVLTSAGLWWLRSSRGTGPGALAPLGWLPYAPAVAVVGGFGLLLYLLAHDPGRRPRLLVARIARWLLPLSSYAILDPDCPSEFEILDRALLMRSHAGQQDARDQVADLAHALLPQARRMADDELRRTIESAVAFVPRQHGQGLDTDRFAELLALFDALFGRLRDDAGHQDIWRIAILRQLIRYTGPGVLPQIFGDLRRGPGGVGVDGLSVSRREGDPGSVLHTAFGRSAALEEAQGLGLIVDLTRAQRESASERREPDEY